MMFGVVEICAAQATQAKEATVKAVSLRLCFIVLPLVFRS
jgi:hypothetical protein